MLRVSCYIREIKCQVNLIRIISLKLRFENDKIQDKMFKILFVVISIIFTLMNSLSHFYWSKWYNENLLDIKCLFTTLERTNLGKLNSSKIQSKTETISFRESYCFNQLHLVARTILETIWSIQVAIYFQYSILYRIWFYFDQNYW